MKAQNSLALLGGYLRRHGKGIAIFVLSGLVCTGVFSLYNLPLEAVMYAFLLSCCIGFAIVLSDYIHYKKKHALLCNLRERIAIATNELPEADDILEEDYQELIELLYQIRNQLASECDISQSELSDYYTLWAHQIKTPIAAMRLMLQSEDFPKNDELAAELFKIEQYVEMALQYLRMENMSGDLKIQHYPLAEIIKSAIRKYAKLFVLQKISLRFEEPPCSVLTDEKWLQFVIEQLLSNALKYTRGGVIAIYMDEDADKTLVIEDTGIGIQPEDLPRIFERGFTGYNGRLDKKSTGIGLYLCKKVLTKLSHTITITSEVGKGTKVKIDLATLDLLTE